MSSKKRKIKTKNISDECCNLKCQRSSLAVNLSCASNLTDSGNGSLKQIDVEYNNDTASATTVNYNTTSKGDRYERSKSKQTHRDFSLKNVRILLEKMNDDNEILNKDCERLKKAILCKTKQVFDVQNELSVKTHTILGNKHNRSNTICNNDFICAATNTKVSAVSNITNKIEHKNKQNNVNQSISSTPGDKCSNKNIEEQRKQYKLKKRQLFNVSEQLNGTNGGDGNMNSKCNSPTLSLSQLKNKNYGSSIILAGSNTKTNTFPNATDSISYRDNSSLIYKDQSVLNISGNESIFTAVPIGCSTMISDQILDTEPENHSQIEYNLFSLNKHTETNVIPMEITRFHGGFILNDKEQSSEQVIKNVTDNFSKQKVLKNDCAPVPLIQNSVEPTITVPKLLNESSKKLEKSILFSTINEKSTKIQCNDQDTQTTAGNSANTIRTSLNVNTSIDAQNKYDKEKYNKDLENRQEIGMYSLISEEARRSVSINYTSLQVNTSLDTLNRLYLHESNTRRLSILNNVANNDTDAEENITNTTNVYKMKNKTVDKTQSGESYIESTLYPICRSGLLKSQFGQNIHNDKNELRNPTEIQSPNNKLCLTRNNVSVECTNSCYEQERIINKRIILNRSSSCDMVCNKSQTSVIIKESTDESELEKDQGTTNSTVLSAKRKCKKKLLPLQECSKLLSFSPVQEEHLPFEHPTHPKRYKKKKKQCIKNKFNSRNHECDMKHIERKSSKQLLLEDDHHIVCDKKKKEKKPKKIISKKIIIKKITDENILKQLEEDRENVFKRHTCISSRNSSSDFQPRKGLSTVLLTRKKVQKINIVVTGLSNDDKNTVKSIVKALGLAKLELNVTKRTTHVVTTGVRTINLLHGIIRGCWLVRFEWILKSLENNAWLSPEKYEMTHFSKAVLENRKDRQLFGTSYVPELFAACGYIYVGKDTAPPYNVLKDLIKTAGGRITDNLERAKIVIGTEGLKETWVLDCITTGELQPYNQYQRH